jgi:hypothetical protein
VALRASEGELRAAVGSALGDEGGGAVGRVEMIMNKAGRFKGLAVLELQSEEALHKALGA